MSEIKFFDKPTEKMYHIHGLDETLTSLFLCEGINSALSVKTSLPSAKHEDLLPSVPH